MLKTYTVHEHTSIFIKYNFFYDIFNNSYLYFEK